VTPEASVAAPIDRFLHQPPEDAMKEASAVATDDFPATREGLDDFREGVAPICDVTLRGAIEDFRMTASTLHLGAAVLVEDKKSEVTYDRTARHVARSGADHFLVSMQLSGGTAHSIGRREVTARPGDILIVDWAEPNQTATIAPEFGGPSHSLTLVLPRRVLAPLLATPDSAPATIIRNDTPYGSLMGEQMLALRRYAPDLTADQQGAVVKALAHLAAGGIGPVREPEEVEAAASPHPLLWAIKIEIEAQLASDALDIAYLCRRFPLSRAGLYRLFAADGGPVNYIQERRLLRALNTLMAPEGMHLRTLDIALECQFSSDSTFIRAFRRRFGMTPGEVRALAKRREAAEDPACAKYDAARWLGSLGRPVRHAPAEPNRR
jgi:AraC-like DNA-binding protein